MLLKNLLLSFRNLAKNKVFSSLGIIGFAAGFSVCLIIGMYIYSELTADKCYENENRIFRVVNAKNSKSAVDYDLNEILKSDFPGIERACPVEINNRNMKVKTEMNVTFVDGIITTTNDFFRVFSINALKSVSELPFADNNSAVITELTAKQLFGNVEPLGKEISINQTKSIITAVIPDFATGSSIQGKILRNSENKNFRMNSYANSINDNFKVTSLTDHYALLDNNDQVGNVESRFNESIRNYNVLVDSVFFEPLSDIYLNTTIKDANKHGSTGFIKILFIIGFFILMLSVINYINYIISSQIGKLKEIGIKKTIGARAFNLLGNYAADILLWVLISLATSIVIVGVSIPYFNALFHIDLHLYNLSKMPFIVGSILVIIFIILSSMIPYFVMLSRFQILNFLKGKTGNRGRGVLGNSLTVFQLTISIVLITGLLIVQKQVYYVKYRDLGFNDDKLLYLELPYYEKNHEAFKNETLKSTHIEKASLCRYIPGSGHATMSDPNKYKNIYHMLYVDEDFITTMGMEIIEGRDLIISDQSTNNCIANEAAIAAMELEHPNLNIFGVGDIIGTIKNFNFESLHNNVEPMFLKYGTGWYLNLRISSQNIPEVMKYIKKVWADFYPDEPIQYKFYDDWFDSLYKKEEQLGYASIIFSVIAIIITCLGLLGKIIQVSALRTKEIGIRKVNGARISEVVAFLNNDFVKWVVIAFIIGAPIAYLSMQKWLENFAFRTDLSWWVFALSGTVIMAISLLTVGWQSWKAARRNPVEALRYE